MELKNISSLLKSTAIEGTAKLIRNFGLLPEFYSKSQAYRLYGRSSVDRWINEGLLQISGTSRACINRVKLEAIASRSNRATYLPVAER